MQSHVFAVWDFMSLLKALQQRLTCTSVPWIPTDFPESRRFLNEIVLGEESDQYEGRAISHFELYLEAMDEASANTAPIRSLIDSIHQSNFSPATIPAPAAAQAFVASTFRVIDSNNLAAMAAAFTFGREDVIPDIFRELVRDLNRQHPGAFTKFIWYLERHIEVDGEDHGPLSLRMVADLCGNRRNPVGASRNRRRASHHRPPSPLGRHPRRNHRQLSNDFSVEQTVIDEPPLKGRACSALKGHGFSRGHSARQHCGALAPEGNGLSRCTHYWNGLLLRRTQLRQRRLQRLQLLPSLTQLPSLRSASGTHRNPAKPPQSTHLCPQRAQPYPSPRR